MHKTQGSKVDHHEKFLNAVQKGNTTLVKTLTSELNERQIHELLQHTHKRSGDQAIHIAARQGHVDILSYLGSLGVDFESANQEGKRALHEAAAAGQPECVAYLLKQGVSVDPLKRADW